MNHEHLHITGIVQGVGMRPFVYREAVSCGVTGWVLNAGDGVHIEAHAPQAVLDRFAKHLAEHAPQAARIESIVRTPLDKESFDPDGAHEFRIVSSSDATERTTLVSPDIATCPDCLRELFDPSDRRYHYPFINCTNCGPRFTIIRALPYDRAATSMNAFPMCAACDHEYRDPLDRRFHAQPDACFACGPHITWRERSHHEGVEEPKSADTPSVGTTRETSDAIIERCAALLADGGIVAIKGLGGFHLACDASNEQAVRELRQRKRRSNKPLAIMVRAIEDAEALCHVNGTERELLEGTVRPIVLLPRHYELEDAPEQKRSTALPLAPSVAHDLPEVGVMLPYTPLQHLLLAACGKLGIAALVMTSGNISEEPIEIDDESAWQHLAPIADALLGNDRAILSRFDDSVVRVVDGAPLLVRRARGYAPRPLELPGVRWSTAAALPVILACGPEQKATLALTRERPDGSAACFVSQHIGDLENAETFSAWHDARQRMEELFDLHPQALACDLHPTYLSGQWARRQASRCGVPLVEVQHHHAHIASVVADAAARGAHNAADPVIGLAFDGTGAGDDQTVWGGEVLLANLEAYARMGHLSPWRLPGGAASVKDPRRNAYSLLYSQHLLDHPGARAFLSAMSDEERVVTSTMIERGINSPLTSSMGRLFDAVAAVLGICTHATYEGEPAIELEAAAWNFIAKHMEVERALAEARLSLRAWHAAEALSPIAASSVQSPSASRPVAANAQQSFVMSTGPLLASLLDARQRGTHPAKLACAFHLAIAELACAAALRTREQTGVEVVALSGGVFMNRLLLQLVQDKLQGQGFRVLVPHGVPVNDGCIAYGQAAIARARLASSQ